MSSTNGTFLAKVQITAGTCNDWSPELLVVQCDENTQWLLYYKYYIHL